MPLDTWAKTETRRTAAPDAAPDTHSDLQNLIAGLSVPPEVAVVTYPRGCRIRRVRVQTPRQPDLTARQAVIVSRRALQQTRRDTDFPGA